MESVGCCKSVKSVGFLFCALICGRLAGMPGAYSYQQFGGGSEENPPRLCSALAISGISIGWIDQTAVARMGTASRRTCVGDAFPELLSRDYRE